MEFNIKTNNLYKSRNPSKREIQKISTKMINRIMLLKKILINISNITINQRFRADPTSDLLSQNLYTKPVHDYVRNDYS